MTRFSATSYGRGRQHGSGDRDVRRIGPGSSAPTATSVRSPYSDAHKVYGRTLHASTVSAAESGAMSACGYSDCQVLVTFTDVRRRRRERRQVRRAAPAPH